MLLAFLRSAGLAWTAAVRLPVESVAVRVDLLRQRAELHREYLRPKTRRMHLLRRCHRRVFHDRSRSAGSESLPAGDPVCGNRSVQCHLRFSHIDRDRLLTARAALRGINPEGGSSRKRAPVPASCNQDTRRDK
jgi:hypothetical protein